MNKEVKKAMASLDEKSTKNRDLISKTESELNATKEKLASLKSDLNNADGPDQYRAIIREINENEAVISFLENRIRKLNESVLTIDEYRSFELSVNGAFRDLKTDYYKSMVSEIDKLVSIVNAYNAEVDELNKALAKVATMRKNTIPSTLVSRTIVNGSDPLNPYTGMYDACIMFQTRMNMRQP